MSEQLITRHSSTPVISDAEAKESLIFVTGGTGLVGAHLIEALIRQGKNVKALYRSQIPDIVDKEKVEWIKGDILDVVFVNEAIQNVGQVYHCAATVSFNPKDKHQMFATNVEGTANVVNASLNAAVNGFCFVSSVAALGRVKNGLEIDENTKWSEETGGSNYGKSKYLAELEVWRGIGEGLKAVIVNPSIILGAGDWNEGSTKIFKTAFEEFPWYTEGETGFVDVKDVVNAMILLTDNNISGERFIVSAENKSYYNIFTTIANAFGKNPPYKKATSFMSELVWRMEAIKSLLTNNNSLLTSETARAAQAIVRFNNTKIKQFIPFFNYTPIDQTINRVCHELQQRF
jgi:dihydroflavonol-4-reductase